MQQTNHVSVQTDLSTVTSFGFILWWSVHKKVHLLSNLMAKGQNLPASAKKNLLGEQADGAFRKSVSLRKKQWIVDQDKDNVSYYVTDRAGEGYTLARETINATGVEISLEQVGSVFLEGFNITFVPTLYYGQYQAEVDKLIAHFQNSFYNILGQVDDTRVRQLLISWLKDNSRVALRPTGGVYLIPLSASNSQKRDTVHSEIVAVRDWIAACGIGELSCIEVFPTVATSKQSIVAAAIEELNQELFSIEESLESYPKKVNMNAGSRMEACNSRVKAMKALQEKVEVLKDAGLLELQIDLVQRRLEANHDGKYNALLEQVADLQTKLMTDPTVVITERDAIESLYSDLLKEEKRTDANLGSNAFDVLLLHSRVDLVMHKAVSMHLEAIKEVDSERALKASMQPVTTSRVALSKSVIAESGKSGTTKSRKSKAI